MAERTLTERELNRALLARQLLLERASLPLSRAVERVGGLQTQYAPSGYIALWSRLEGFKRDDLTKALERRSLVQGTLMRVTIHVVSARDYPLLAAGVRDGRRRWWLQLHKGVEAREVAAAARRLRSILKEGPRRLSELNQHFAPDDAAWNGAGLWLDLVRVPPSGTWDRRRADLYGLAETWLAPSDATPEQGLEHLIRRYLGGFGPASIKDIANWAGLPVKMLAPSVKLRRFRDERGEELLDLPRAPLPHPDTPAPIRFLPTWDATLLVHARRTQILPERYRSLVFNTQTPHSVSTFLVDGQVAGTWRYERGYLEIDPFERLSREARKELEQEAERLEAFYS